MPARELFLIPQFPVWCTGCRVQHYMVSRRGWVGVRVCCILEVIIVCTGGISLRVSSLWIRLMTVWLSMSWSFFLYFSLFLFLEFCTCNLSSSLLSGVSRIWASAPFFFIFSSLIFLLLYPWKLEIGSLSRFHYCMLSYKTHKAKQKFPP